VPKPGNRDFRFTSYCFKGKPLTKEITIESAQDVILSIPISSHQRSNKS